MVLVTMLREDGFDALPARVLASVFVTRYRVLERHGHRIECPPPLFPLHSAWRSAELLAGSADA